MYPHNLISKIMERQLKPGVDFLQLGDTIRVGTVIQEGNKQRTQFYMGTLVAKNGSGRNSTVTILRSDVGIAVKRTFYLNSRLIDYKVIKKELST